MRELISLFFSGELRVDSQLQSFESDGGGVHRRVVHEAFWHCRRRRSAAVEVVLRGHWRETSTTSHPWPFSSSDMQKCVL
ncbi:hypothetical protein EX30DRAFT_109019 [Ascodesmis nigricans]|uniref:Uncharacterized protein n=1 Tax=Ascodesmis nigricans TaxID=341454 RepID=A0A4S2MQP5_9PEZI|nr:hypothetical protein EX30DRAFT_109019 [Ascodesmis nigricans]